MNPNIENDSTVGVLVSGGPDSCVLVAQMLDEGHCVRPFYVRCGLAWEADELAALKKFLASISSPRLAELIVFALPLADLYGGHWSVVGRGVPGADTPDGAVYLPGRNALLALKPAVWCAMHGVERLALAVLAGNPFGDAGEEFFTAYATALRLATGARLELLRPFAAMGKSEVLRLGAALPLELTFSCIAPLGGRHCGRCNKCAERRRAFQAAGLNDPTKYVVNEIHPGDC